MEIRSSQLHVIWAAKSWFSINIKLEGNWAHAQLDWIHGASTVGASLGLMRQRLGEVNGEHAPSDYRCQKEK